MLFFKECKKILFSLTFLIYIIAVSGFYFTQFYPDAKEKISPPIKNSDDYGTIVKEIPEILMPSAIEGLVTEYMRGYYTAYPIGFYKKVNLSEKKSAQIAEIITEITGISEKELSEFEFNENSMIINQPDENGEFTPIYQAPEIPEINISDTMTYERFRELMRKADKIIGGGSDYSDDNIVESFSRVPKTYEDALEDYNVIIEKDKITGAFARLFCDYMGIIVSILPVFVAVSLVNSDKKSCIKQLIYSRKISSIKLIFTRFLAIITMLAVPVILLALLATFSIQKIYSENSIDFFAIPKMSICWLIPNILFSVASGIFLTEISSPLIAIFLQGTIWIGSVMSNTNLTGNIDKFTLICRHNSIYDRNYFLEDLSKFTFNKIFYTIISIAIIIFTIWIYSEKRKGGFYVIRKHSAHKS